MSVCDRISSLSTTSPAVIKEAMPLAGVISTAVITTAIACAVLTPPDALWLVGGGMIAGMAAIGIYRMARSCRLKARERQLLQRALSSHVIKKLYDQANAVRSGPLRIKLISETNEGLDAHANLEERIIRIRSEVSDDRALVCLVFELINHLHIDRFEEVAKKASSGKISRDEFAYQIEQVEFDGTKIHHKVMREAIQEKGWSEDLDEYNAQESCFDEAWNGRLKNSSHAEKYRKDYDMGAFPL